MSAYSTLENEIWKNIPNYEGSYQVSNYGRIKSLSRVHITGRGGAKRIPERIIKQQLSVFGYYRVGLWKKCKTKRRHVHHLVLEAFVGPKPCGKECRHLDGNRTNNKLGNLQWATHSENINDRKKHGTEIWGEQNGQARLTKEEVQSIRQLYFTGRYSMAKLAKDFCVGTSTIHRVVNRLCWKWVK